MYKKRPFNRLVFDEMIKRGYMNFIAEFVASKDIDYSNLDSILNPTGEFLNRLDELEESKEASEIIYKHLINNSNILSITDSDCDGVSSAYVIDRAILNYFNHPKDKFTTIINERKFGNGVNDEMIRRTLELHKEKPIGLVITADHGSSDDARFKILRDNDIEVVVTDHHSLPNTGRLINANAFVNPIKDNFCKYNISGCQVIFLVMLRVYDLFKENNRTLLKEDNLDSIYPVMANTILSDSMNLLEPINRYMLKKGLKLLNETKEICWVLVKDSMKLEYFDENVLSFSFTPIINAANRLGKPRLAFEFLTARDPNKGLILLKKLVDINNERKTLESEMISYVNLTAKLYRYKHTKVFILPKGPGVAGLVSQTIGDRYNCPTITFTLNKDGDLTGSGRTILKGLNLKEIFDKIEHIDKDIFLRKGGHAGAAGCTIREEKIEDFMRIFDDVVLKSLDNIEEIEDTKFYDFEIPMEYLTETVISKINEVGPFGMDYRQPILKTTGILNKVIPIGRPPLHHAVEILTKDRSKVIKGFYPRSGHSRLNKKKYQEIEVLASLNFKQYNGNKSLELVINDIK